MIDAIISVISKYHHLPLSQHSGSLPTVWETLIFVVMYPTPFQALGFYSLQHLLKQYG
jgi:hypothetical protein